MKKEQRRESEPSKTEARPYRVRLPGFVSDEEVGLGDVIKRATSAIGIKTCGGCARRAAASTAGWFSPASVRTKTPIL